MEPEQLVPIHEPLPDIERRLILQDQLGRIDYLIRRIAILDAKLALIGDKLWDLGNRP
jgi:hypothetical protein